MGEDRWASGFAAALAVVAFVLTLYFTYDHNVRAIGTGVLCVVMALISFLLLKWDGG